MLGGVGVAAASGVDGRDLIGEPHSSIDNSSRDGNAGGSDPSTLNRDCTVNAGNDASSGSTDAPASGGGGSSGVHPAGQRTSLGWQSLLPGSIQ